MADHARIKLQDDIDYAEDVAKLLVALAQVIEAGPAGKRIMGETAIDEAVEALEYAASIVHRHVANAKHVRANYDAKVAEPVEAPRR